MERKKNGQYKRKRRIWLWLVALAVIMVSFVYLNQDMWAPVTIVEAEPQTVTVVVDPQEQIKAQELSKIGKSPEYQAWALWKKEAIFFEEKKKTVENQYQADLAKMTADYQQAMAEIEANLDRLRAVEMELVGF